MQNAKKGDDTKLNNNKQSVTLMVCSTMWACPGVNLYHSTFEDLKLLADF